MSRCFGHVLKRGATINSYNSLKTTSARVSSLFEVDDSRCSLCHSNTSFYSSYKKGKLGQSSLLLQHGLDIQELPVIVRKADDRAMVLMCKPSDGDDTSVTNGDVPSSTGYRKNSDISDDIESQEMIKGFQKCYSAKGVFTLLDLIPANEVTPPVALQALKTIIRLENNQQYRNITYGNVEEKTENFTRTAVFNNLVDLIAASDDSQVVLEGLHVVSRDVLGGNTNAYRQKLCDEVLIRVTDGKFSVSQVCDAIRTLTLLGGADNDKLWIGIFDKGDNIDETNIMEVFRILPHLRQSRRLVINILEKKIMDLWWKFKSKDIAEILSILNGIKCRVPHIITHISRWINTNIHTLNEEDVLCIVRECIDLEESEQGVEKALERYVKAKGLKIKNPEVFAIIMDYCRKFKVRSTLIFDGCSEYFIHKSNQLSPLALKSLFYPFGYLDFHPTNSVKFWKAFEEELSEHFVQLCPEDSLDIMLSCVYLEKYPLNFVKKVFNPYFLDRLHSAQDYNLLKALRAKLKLFDTAMTLECQLYRGPLLPRDHSAKSIWQDGRIRRMAFYLVEVFSRILKNNEAVSSNVVLSQLPLIDLYVVDILLHPEPSFFSLNMQGSNNKIAFLIHVPEHYDSSGQHLIGPQMMRRRHFKLQGLSVVDTKYEELAKLKVHPKELEEYLLQKIHEAEPAL